MISMYSIMGILQNFKWWAIFDLIVFVALSIVIFIFLKKRNSMKVAVAIALYTLVYVGVTIGNNFVDGLFEYTLKILNYMTIAIIMASIIVYKQDIKVFFNKFGHAKKINSKYDFDTTDDNLLESANQIVRACQNMSKNDIGALIIVAPNEVPSQILETGTVLNANVSSGLIESIFYTKSPLHDGAVFIKGDKVLSAGCFLPLSQEVGIAKELGTRHRAAIGVTEENDVFAIVVSEETGIISVACKGKIKRYMTPEKLLEELKQVYGIVSNQKTDKKRERKFFE